MGFKKHDQNRMVILIELPFFNSGPVDGRTALAAEKKL